MTGYVYSPSTRALKAVLDRVSDYYWEDLFAGAGEIEFYTPLDYASDIEEDDIIWFGGRKAAVVEGLAKAKDKSGKKQLKVSGRTAEAYLERRTIYPTVKGTGNVSSMLLLLISNNITNPSDVTRKIPFITLDLQQQILGPVISYQQTGGDLLKEVCSLCQAHSLGFSLDFDPYQVSFVLKIFEGVNRSRNQSVNPVVYLTSDQEDILDASYQSSIANQKNFAYVAGEGEGSNRTYTTVDVANLTGHLRKELFVDARDLQTDVDGTTIDSSTYTSMLKDRGLKKLESCKPIREFSADITQNPKTYVFGVDYQIGDTVTVYDTDLQVTVDAVISAFITSKAKGNTSTAISVGYGPPTIYQRLKELM